MGGGGCSVQAAEWIAGEKINPFKIKTKMERISARGFREPIPVMAAQRRQKIQDFGRNGDEDNLFMAFAPVKENRDRIVNQRKAICKPTSSS